jgi:integrase
MECGLRAKEIANLKWSMILTPEGEVGDDIHLTNTASKGRSGRVIPLKKQQRQNLEQMLVAARQDRRFYPALSYVVTTERSAHTSPQAVVNMFKRWYGDIGLLGCSSHSGRRTLFTNAARKISTGGRSLRDVQMLADH